MLKWVAKVWKKYSFSAENEKYYEFWTIQTHKTSKVKDNINECETVLLVIKVV